jgi:hypothetical protein
MTYEAALNQEAAGAETPDAPKGGKKSRAKTEAVPKSYPQFNEDGTPQLDGEGKQVWGPEKSTHKAKKAKKVKEIEYQKGEDGEFLLDEKGDKIPVPKKARAPKLDADGNPIPRQVNVFLGTQVITLTDQALKVSYRPDSKRGTIFASIKDGMTVDEFYAANQGKAVSHTFLVWYLNEAKVIDIA